MLFRLFLLLSFYFPVSAFCLSPEDLIKGIQFSLPVEVEFQGSFAEYGKEKLAALVDVLRTSLISARDLSPPDQTQTVFSWKGDSTRLKGRRLKFVITDRNTVELVYRQHKLPGESDIYIANFILEGTNLEQEFVIIIKPSLVLDKSGTRNKYASTRVLSDFLGKLYGYIGFHLKQDLREILQMNKWDTSATEIEARKSLLEFYKKAQTDPRLLKRADSLDIIAHLTQGEYDQNLWLREKTEQNHGPLVLPHYIHTKESTSPEHTEELNRVIYLSFFLARILPPPDLDNHVFTWKGEVPNEVKNSILLTAFLNRSDPFLEDINSIYDFPFLVDNDQRSLTEAFSTINDDNRRFHYVFTWLDHTFYNASSKKLNRYRLAKIASSLAGALYGPISFRLARPIIDLGDSHAELRKNKRHTKAVLGFIKRLRGSPYWDLLTSEERTGFNMMHATYTIKHANTCREILTKRAFIDPLEN